MHIACVAGARPNFVKIKPIMDALEARSVRVSLVHAGQHYDASMSQVFFDDLGLRDPDHYLEAGSGTHAEQTSNVMKAFEPLLREITPDLVVLVGDVNSTLGCALVTSKSDSQLAHVEAGLRSRDRTMPEEINREVTDLLSDLLFASEPSGSANLLAEGRAAKNIHLVGNVMVDSLLANLERARDRDVPARFGVTAGGYALVTLHRPSNVDQHETLANFMDLFEKISGQMPVVFPCHPRTAESLRTLRESSGVKVVQPLGYLDFIGLEADAGIVLTDSGGVQEETTALGVPCLTLRENTERPITVEEGTNKVVGTNPTRILEALGASLQNRSRGRRPELWDGHAARRIADVILQDADG